MDLREGGSRLSGRAACRGRGDFPAVGAPSAPLPRRVGLADRLLHHPGRHRERLVVRYLADLHGTLRDPAEHRPVDVTEADLAEGHR